MGNIAKVKVKMGRKRTNDTEREVSELGRRILHLMDVRNIKSMAELERMADLPTDTVRRICGGLQNTTRAEVIMALAKVLGVSAEDLSGGDITLSASPLNVAPTAISPRWWAISGDAMYPTFKSGDHILIDFGINTLSESGVYAIKPTVGDTIIRRVDLNPFDVKVFVRSDNSQYRAEGETDPDTIVIVGKVIGHFVKM